MLKLFRLVKPYRASVATGFGRMLRGAIFARVEHFSIHRRADDGDRRHHPGLSQDTQPAWVLIAVMPALIVMLNLTSIAIIWFGSHRAARLGVGGAHQRGAGGRAPERPRTSSSSTRCRDPRRGT